jgi:multidrug resistance efflux pump
VDITASNPPAVVMAKSTGKIEKLFIKDNQMVKKDDMLAIIENTANYSDVIKITSSLSSLKASIYSSEPALSAISNEMLKLGDIQPAYSSFLKQYNNYRNFVLLGYHQKKIESIHQEINQQGEYLDGLANKLKYSNEQLFLSKKQFQRDSSLFKNEVISLADYEKSQSQHIEVKSNYESMNTELLSTQVQITKLNQSLIDLESEQLEQSAQQRNALVESYESVLAQIAGWEKLYVLTSPVSGKVTFTKFWTNNQNIKTGDAVFTVVSPDSKYFIAKIQLPVQSSGKAKTGQKVIIKLDDFPYMEYGLLTGRISKISLVPDNDYYVAEMLFPSKLITTYGKDISFKNGLKGTSEIIIKDERLLYKFIYPVKALIDKNKNL